MTLAEVKASWDGQGLRVVKESYSRSIPLDQIFTREEIGDSIYRNDPAIWLWLCPRCSSVVISREADRETREDIAQDALCCTCRRNLREL